MNYLCWSSINGFHSVSELLSKLFLAPNNPETLLKGTISGKYVDLTIMFVNIPWFRDHPFIKLCGWVCFSFGNYTHRRTISTFPREGEGGFCLWRNGEKSGFYGCEWYQQQTGDIAGISTETPCKWYTGWYRICFVFVYFSVMNTRTFISRKKRSSAIIWTSKCF